MDHDRDLGAAHRGAIHGRDDGVVAPVGEHTAWHREQLAVPVGAEDGYLHRPDLRGRREHDHTDHAVRVVGGALDHARFGSELHPYARHLRSAGPSAGSRREVLEVDLNRFDADVVEQLLRARLDELDHAVCRVDQPPLRRGAARLGEHAAASAGDCAEGRVGRVLKVVVLGGVLDEEVAQAGIVVEGQQVQAHVNALRRPADRVDREVRGHVQVHEASINSKMQGAVAAEERDVVPRVVLDQWDARGPSRGPGVAVPIGSPRRAVREEEVVLDSVKADAVLALAVPENKGGVGAAQVVESDASADDEVFLPRDRLVPARGRPQHRVVQGDLQVCQIAIWHTARIGLDTG
eukprot:3941038-Rhodomonas_salina.1